jgi:hypothetical protein
LKHRKLKEGDWAWCLSPEATNILYHDDIDTAMDSTSMRSRDLMTTCQEHNQYNEIEDPDDWWGIFS